MCSVPADVACPIAVQAGNNPEAMALTAGNAAYSYAAFDKAIISEETRLRHAGVLKGDRVVITLPPSPEYCISLWALWHLGVAACPVNPALPQPNMEEVIALLAPHWILKEGLSHASAASRDCPSFSLHASAASRDCPSFSLQARIASPDCPSFSLQARIARRDSLPLCTIVMTSGSSGVPRAAAHSMDNHLVAARAANRNMPLFPGDRWLLSLPLFHVAGLAVLFRCAIAGATVAVPAPGEPLEEALVRLRATHLSLVPTQLYRLLESPKAMDVLRAMKGILLGGAPASRDLITRAYEAGLPLVCSYGMTETAAQLCATAPGAALDELLSSGRPLTEGTVRIGEGGVIEVTGETLFRGYYTGNGVCLRPGSADDWFRTGDVGFFDDVGRLHVTGRADIMFICGGENIQPEEIEAAMCALPGVCRAVVVPVPNAEYGNVPVAFVAMNAPDMDERTLVHALAERLPRYKIPRHVLPWPEEVSSGMKADRAALAAAAARRLL